MTEHDAFEQVLDDLRELAGEHPEYRSIMLRALRALRETFVDVADVAAQASA